MRPSSTKKRIKTGILRFLRCFSEYIKKGKDIKKREWGRGQILGPLRC